MLDERDLQLIGLELGKVLEHNITPQFEGIYKRLDKIELRLDTEMVTKTYLDEKMGNLESKLLVQDRKLEKKTDALIEALVDRRTLKPSDFERLEQSRVFPHST